MIEQMENVKLTILSDADYKRIFEKITMMENWPIKIIENCDRWAVFDFDDSYPGDSIKLSALIEDVLKNEFAMIGDEYRIARVPKKLECE